MLAVLLWCMLQAALLVGQGGAGVIPTAGLVLGFAVAAGMLAYNTQRALDLQYNDGDWVGVNSAGIVLAPAAACSVVWLA